MDFEANKKYWYHKEDGRTTYIDPAIESDREKMEEEKIRKMKQKKRLYAKRKSNNSDSEDDDSSDDEAEAVEELLREELGGSEESEYDSEDIPLGSTVWKGKDGEESSSSDSDSDSDEDGEQEGETKENEAGEYSVEQNEWPVEEEQTWDETGGYEAAGEANEWEQVYDEASGQWYNFNATTGETSWA